MFERAVRSLYTMPSCKISANNFGRWGLFWVSFSFNITVISVVIGPREGFSFWFLQAHFGMVSLVRIHAVEGAVLGLATGTRPG